MHSSYHEAHVLRFLLGWQQKDPHVVKVVLKGSHHGHDVAHAVACGPKAQVRLQRRDAVSVPCCYSPCLVYCKVPLTHVELGHERWKMCAART